MDSKRILIIGGSGFLGKHLACALAKQGHRVIIPTRRRDQVKSIGVSPRVQLIQANVSAPDMLSQLIKGVDAVISLAGILHDTSAQTPFGRDFAKTHVDLPKKIAEAMQKEGVRRLVHISALKADKEAPSGYLRSKAAGEAVLKAADNIDLTIFRPSVIFGEDDVFLNKFAALLKCLPCLPLAGAHTRFQPVHVEDVVNAIVDCLFKPATFGATYELAGPRIYSLQTLVEYVGELTGHPRPVIELPEAISFLQAKLLSYLPNPPITPDNLRSMEVDNIADGHHNYPHWQPRPLESVAPLYLAKQFAQAKLDRMRRSAGRREYT